VLNGQLAKGLSLSICLTILLSFLVPFTEGALAAGEAPELLVTEIAPNILGAEDYEYFELHNPSSETVELGNYQFFYFYTDGSYPDVPLTLPEYSLQTDGTVVLWFNKSSKTKDDFRNHYGSSIKDSVLLEFTGNGFTGMANSGNRGIKLVSQTGETLNQADYLGEEVGEKLVKEFKLVIGSSKMAAYRINSIPTPGIVDTNQFTIDQPADKEQPVINHSPITQADARQDLNIQAKVSDNQSVQTVTLSYRFNQTAPWTDVPMTLKDEPTYEASIPKASLRSTQIFYKITATDGVNTVSTDEYAAAVAQPQYDPQQVPEFLVTEVVPDSTNVNGLDGYEFIEIYNNTDQAINFKDYKIRYRYPMDGPEADLTWAGEKEDIIISSGETLVFWIINKGNTEKTVDDFNANYKTDLEENKNIVKVFADGMANGSDRGIVVATNTGHEIATSYYNDEPNKKDPAANQGILYAFPVDGSNQMAKISSATEFATPGTVTDNQVPGTKLAVQEDTEKPVFEDLTNRTEVDEKSDLPLLFDVQDNLEAKTVRLYYKNNEQADYRSVDLAENFDDQMYHHTVYLPEIIGKEYVEYYLLVSDGPNTIQTEKTTVKIIGDDQETGLRMNLKDETILSKDAIITASSSPEAYEDITLQIDGADVTANTYRTLEKPAYFAFEVKKTNLFFKNGVTMGDEVLHIFDDTINSYVTMSIPIQPEQIEYDGDTVISIRSGTKVSPFDTNSEENRDDFYIKNIRLVLSDGTVIYDPDFSNKEKELTVGDGGTATPTYNFSFSVPIEKFISKAYKWDTTAAEEGQHTVAANEGTSKVSSTVTVDNSAPEIVASVEEGKDYKGSFTIDADIEDRYSGVAESKALLDGQEISLPLETSSALLSPGAHTLEITAVDTVGNTGKKTVGFTVVEEQPYEPKVLAPEQEATGVSKNAKLSVEVTDPTNDQLQVEFFEGFNYKPTDAEIKVTAHASDTEPPLEVISPDETTLTEAELQKIDEKDGEYVTTTSMEKFPYQRFEVEVDPKVTGNDTIEINWDGKSLPGRKVSMYVWNLTSETWELQQWKVAGEEDFSLTAKIKGEEYIADQKVQVLIQDEIAAESATDYTLVWMSDTQYYSESYPHIYKRMVDWVAENKETLNVPYVFHTGDLVDVATDDQQWAYADEYMGVLENAKIPYGVLAGNHDVDHKTNDYSQFSKYFGTQRFNDQPYYGESYKDNRGHYDLISSHGNDFIMVYMGWGVDEEGIQWMNDVLKQYPDRMAILNFHEYLLVSGNRSPIGNQIYEKVVLPNKNVIATLSGHYHDSETLIDEIDDNGDGTPDRKVYQMLADYQGGPEGGQGYLRLLHVNQADNKIYVKTYSPYLDDYNYYEPEQYPGKDEFVIDMPLQPKEKVVSTDKFEINVYTASTIGKTQLADNSQAETKWKNLKDGQQYGWYVRVTDGFGGEVISDVWTFSVEKPGNGPKQNKPEKKQDDKSRKSGPHPDSKEKKIPGEIKADEKRPDSGKTHPSENTQNTNQKPIKETEAEDDEFKIP
jgi:hypothetical protein